MAMTHPTLYKKTSTGAIQFWTISVKGNEIITTYGQVGTDSPQVTTDVIKEGKNAGQSNATSAAQQAEREAKSSWTKKKKKGYVDSIEAAEAGEVDDDVITGGILPMLAHKYSVNGVLTKDAKKIKFPAFGQPKMDGIRCIAIKENGVCTLWTRTRKPIKSVPHIIKAIEAIPVSNMILDGELYNHDYRQDFDTIIELVRPDEPVEGHEVVQLWLYDTVTDQPFRLRTKWLKDTVAPNDTLVLVDTYEIKSAADVEAFKIRMLERGFEGSMLRNADAPYDNKVTRSYNLQKCKDMTDDEFPIVDFEEGNGRLQGHVGSFWCVTKEGGRFKAKPKGKTSKLRDYFKDHSLWKGKLLTVQYQNFTPDGLPRFPVGKGIRDYE
jgi:ATP-dependent DNA ligase